MSRITLHKGDITEADTDAIVNAANSALWMGAAMTETSGKGLKLFRTEDYWAIWLGMTSVAGQ